MHAYILVASGIFLLSLVFSNRWRARRLNVSLAQSLLRPSQLILAYMFAFFLMGSMFFLSQNVLQSHLLFDATSWKLWGVFIWGKVSIVSIFLTNIVRFGLPISSFNTTEGKTNFPWEALGFIFAVLFAISESSFFLMFSTALYFAGATNGRVKTPLYIVFLLLGVAAILPNAAHGKRLLIFPIVIVLAMVWRDGIIRSRSFFAIIIATFLLILPLSVMRGYGSFGAETFLDAVNYVGAYISSDYFIAAFGNNLEAVSFYFHGMNSLQMALQSGDYLWGETVFNMFFLGSSLYGFEDGLRSSIEVYTNNYAPGFREIGGSYPVMILSEFIMNFGVFSVIVFPLFLIFLDTIWRKIKCYKNSSLRFCLEAILLYSSLLLARGASFDLFLFNIIFLTFPILTVVWGSSKVRLRKKTHA